MEFEPKLPEDGINVSKTHPISELVLLLGGLVAVVVVIVVSVALTLDLVVPRLPVGLERRLFAPEWLAGLTDDEGDAAADPADVWLQATVDRMARHWADNPYAFRAVVFESEEPNALAFPGGWIAVTSGLLDAAGSENEVAFVVGHELGHFRNRDHLRGLGRGLILSLIAAAIGSSGAGTAAEIASMAGLMAERGFSREQESEADVFGLELLAAEYGHVDGAGDFFARMPDPEEAMDRQLGSYLSTHPLHEERIEALHELARERGYRETGELTPLPD